MTEERWMLDPSWTERHLYQSGIHDCDEEGCVAESALVWVVWWERDAQYRS